MYAKPSRSLLAASVIAALYTSTAGANAIIVAGTCTIDAAIASANTDTSVSGCIAGSGADAITIPLGSYPVGELPHITSDIAFVGLGPTPPMIAGDGAHRLFFIGSDTSAPIVSFSNLILSGGVAKGGNATNAAGAGAGLGGAVFIYDGDVTIAGASFTGNGASGGSASGFNSLHTGGGGGGGMYGAGGSGASNYSNGGAGGYGGFGGGGGGGGISYPSEGGGTYGGDGGGTFGGSKATADVAPTGGGFGGGGGGGAPRFSPNPSWYGAGGGFGGGGGGGGASGGTFNADTPGAGGPGGFGGGGGAAGNATAAAGANGGMGGFGGGGGAFGLLSGAMGLGGFGGGDAIEGGGGGGAGFGGAIFVRSGHLAITNSVFDGNSSTHGSSASGGNFGVAKGAALFAVNLLTNANGNQQGMPVALPVVGGCANTFTNNAADDAGSTNGDNTDVFGADRTGLTLACDDRVFADGFDPPGG